MFRRITRRRIIIGLLVAVAFIGGAAVVALLAVRMGYLDRWLINRLQTKLAEYGARMEIDSLQTAVRGLSVEARGLRFYVEGASEPFATLERATVVVTLRDLLGWSGPTEINVRDCELEGLRARYTIDAEGRSNLSGLHSSTNPTQRFSVRYKAGTFAVRKAEFLYLDRLHRLDGAARDLSLDLRPVDGDLMKLIVSARKSDFSYDGRESKDLDLDLQALVNEIGARVESLKISGPLLSAQLQGELKDWRAFDYRLDGQADLRLRDLGTLLAPDLRLGWRSMLRGPGRG